MLDDEEGREMEIALVNSNLPARMGQAIVYRWMALIVKQVQY
jgi:hypothetical protein